MGVTKHLIPKSTRGRMVDVFNERYPEGFIRKNAANAATFTGLLAVVGGAILGGKVGVALRAGGELADDVDGDIARAFDVASEGGKKADHVSDKFKIFAEVGRLAWDSRKLSDTERPIRQAAIGLIAAKHTTIAGLTLYAQAKNYKPDRNPAGQVNMWVDGITAAAFGVSDVIEDPVKKKALAGLGYIGSAVGIATGALAINGYVDNYLINPQQAESADTDTPQLLPEFA